MRKRWIPAVGAVVVLLGSAGKSEAQFFFLPIGFGNPVFGYGPGGSYGLGNYTGWYPGGFPFSTIPRYYGGYNTYGPISTGIMNYQPAPTTNSYVAYAGPGSTTASTTGYVSYTLPDRPAQVDVRVPPGAELWFDGQRTSQASTDRTFHTPPLERGQGYHYEVRARWTEDGKTVEQTQRVPVTAGARVNIVFPRPKS
jgi:uncharacterized protein (TIGR03000 family)